MIRLRPYKSGDARFLLNWFADERTFRMWCADRFDYPLTAEQLETYRRQYENDPNGWSFTALEESGAPVGHLMMRLADYENGSVHIGFVAVAPEMRGRGYGKEMVRQALRYAFEILGVRRATLGVFDCNPAAHACYLACGFRDEEVSEGAFPFHGEAWGRIGMAAEKEAE